MAKVDRLARELLLVALVPCTCLHAASAAAATSVRLSLDRSYLSSAGVYDASGKLLRTLWRGKQLPAGEQQFIWDDRDDAGELVVAERVSVRVLYHQVSYRWDGVIGNTSESFSGEMVHHAMFPPASMAIAGNRAFYAVGYNEGHAGTHGFALARPQLDLKPVNLPDAFSAWSLVATDGRLIYWANAGGISPFTFVAASAFAAEDFVPLKAGSDVCVHYTAERCYPKLEYKGVIDIAQDKQSAATGMAVQVNGNILAVAHGRQGTVRLFDKISGVPLRNFSIPISADATNQLAAAPGGDLWLVSGNRVVRYTALDTNPVAVASIAGLSNPLAVAVHPSNDDIVLVADGGTSQQVKAFDRFGRSLWRYGMAGGYKTDPGVSFDKLWFRFDATLERTALAMQLDGSFWVVDTSNNRMLHISKDRHYIEQVAYLPRSYSATVDPGNPERLFSNYLEFQLNPADRLAPGAGVRWQLRRNWLAGIPVEAQAPSARNGDWTGLQTVATLANGRTYALSVVGNSQVLLELPERGAARYVRAIPAPGRGDTAAVLYANGELGYAHTGTVQAVYRRSLVGFDAAGDPFWESPRRIGYVPNEPGTPVYKGAFSGATGPRFPITSTNKVIFLDQSVNGEKRGPGREHHLGAMNLGGTDWIWKASPPGTIDDPGTFLTQAVDKGVTYGANMVWAAGREIVYGYHGEGFTDGTRGVGQANQFMHFHDDGMFIGQFGVPTTRAKTDADPGVAGNAFSSILIDRGVELLLFHNDEAQHGGIHRWTIGNLASVRELAGTGVPGGVINLQ